MNSTRYLAALVSRIKRTCQHVLSASWLVLPAVCFGLLSSTTRLDASAVYVLLGTISYTALPQSLFKSSLRAACLCNRHSACELVSRTIIRRNASLLKYMTGVTTHQAAAACNKDARKTTQTPVSTTCIPSGCVSSSTSGKCSPVLPTSPSNLSHTLVPVIPRHGHFGKMQPERQSARLSLQVSLPKLVHL